MNYTCIRCKKNQPKTNFSPSNLGNCYYICRLCHYHAYRKEYKATHPRIQESQNEWGRKNYPKYKKYFQDYYLRNKEDILDRQQERYKICRTKHLNWQKNYAKTPEGRFASYKANAKKRRLSFELTIEQFKSFWRKPCYYCGDGITTIGLDRIENLKGYIISNVISCCGPCNKAKESYSHDEYINRCKRIASFH